MHTKYKKIAIIKPEDTADGSFTSLCSRYKSQSAVELRMRLINTKTMDGHEAGFIINAGILSPEHVVDVIAFANRIKLSHYGLYRTLPRIPGGRRQVMSAAAVVSLGFL